MSTIIILIISILALVYIECRLWIINIHLRGKLLNVQNALYSLFTQYSALREEFSKLNERLNK